MKISIKRIKKIREETSASVMDIKRVLEEARGDERKARELLVKHGFEKAGKKLERQTDAGRIFTYVHHSGAVGSMVSLLCETDFVARTDEFGTLGREIAMQVASMNPKDVEELKKQEYIRDQKHTIESLVKETIAKTGENIQIKDFKRFEI